MISGMSITLRINSQSNIIMEVKVAGIFEFCNRLKSLNDIHRRARDGFRETRAQSSVMKDIELVGHL